MLTSTIFLYAVLGAVILVYVPYMLVAYGRVAIGIDLAAPRAMFDKLPPYAQRATWAHQNSFESLMVFAPAAIIAYVTGVDSPWAFKAAIIYLVARLLYSLFYVLSIPLARSLMFGIGSACIFTLYGLSLVAVSS